MYQKKEPPAQVIQAREYLIHRAMASEAVVREKHEKQEGAEHVKIHPERYDEGNHEHRDSHHHRTREADADPSADAEAEAYAYPDPEAFADPESYADAEAEAYDPAKMYHLYARGFDTEEDVAAW